MPEELVSLERIRALAQCLIDDATDMVAEVGEAGANEDRARADVARRIIAVLDGKPEALPAVRQRVPILVVTALDDYARSGIAPPQPLRAMLEGDLFKALAYVEYNTSVLGDLQPDFVAIAQHIRDAMHPSVIGSPEAVSRWISRRRA